MVKVAEKLPDRFKTIILEDILDSAYMLIALMDKDFNFVHVNPRYAAADEKKPEDLIGKNHFDLFPNDENKEIFQRVVISGESHFEFAKPFEYAYAPERGQTYWDWTRIPVKDSIGQVSVLLLMILDVTERVKAQRKLVDYANSLARAYEETINAWAEVLELRDKETGKHAKRVAAMTIELAILMGVPGKLLPHIQRGAILHDIGKMVIPNSILNKPRPLSPEEYEIVKQHPTFACNLLSKIGFLDQAKDIPCFHHERWDGSGYPFGIKGEEIPLAARIFAVVDVFDALISDRVYRKKWPVKKAVDYIKQESGRSFDPSAVKAFLDLIKQKTWMRDSSSLKLPKHELFRDPGLLLRA